MLKAAIFAVLLLSLPALASPKVGDQAVYDVTATKGGQSSNFTMITEIVQLDATGSKYLQRQTNKIVGKPDQVQDEWKSAGDMLTDEKVAQILNFCTQVGGTQATINVPAGNFASCILPVHADENSPASGRVWIAKVSFGVVHAELDQGTGVSTVMSLRSYH